MILKIMGIMDILTALTLFLMPFNIITWKIAILLGAGRPCPFHQHRLTAALAQGDDAAQIGAFLLILRHGIHEDLVDLERGCGQLPEIAQR